MTMTAMISQRIRVPIKSPDIFPFLLCGPLFPARPSLSPSADRLEPAHLFGQRGFDRQALHGRSAVKSVAGLSGLHDEVGVGGLGDRSAMGQDQNVGSNLRRRAGPCVDERGAVAKLERRP